MTLAITGATGFLGLRLLPLLMERGQQVVVLAHAGSPAARDRIARHLVVSGNSPDAADDLTVLLADVTKPMLGLPQWQFRALAPKLTEIWHLAALVDVAAPPERVRPVNVAGTRAVLELASAGTSMLYHVSTAFVAGQRPTGLVMEDDLDASYGFVTAYEESKYDGEKAVHEWSRAHGRPAVIFRPSVLVTDQAPAPGGTRSLLSAVATMADATRLLMPEKDGGSRLPLRLVAEPDSHLNLIPVELAARLMAELAGRIQPSGVTTAHITYPHEVGIEIFAAIVEQRFGIEVQLVSGAPTAPSALEALTVDQLRVFMPYGIHHRHYDRGALRNAGLDTSDAPPLDATYLMAGLTTRLERPR